jgi:chemotaxis protein MotB
VLKGGGQDLTRTTGQVKRGDVESERKTVNLKALKEEQIRAEISRLRSLQQRIEGEIQSNPALGAFRSQILLELTRDGLRIQIVDAQSRPMFASGSAQVQPYMQDLLRAIGAVLAEVPNRLTLEGHTDAMPFSGGQRGYSNWELSADRANASRRELLAGGLPDDRVLRVQGLAASQLLKREQPDDPANRRISIVVMTREAEDAMFKSQPAADGDGDAEPSIRPERPTVISSPPPRGR